MPYNTYNSMFSYTNKNFRKRAKFCSSKKKKKKHTHTHSRDNVFFKTKKEREKKVIKKFVFNELRSDLTEVGARISALLRYVAAK